MKACGHPLPHPQLFLRKQKVLTESNDGIYIILTRVTTVNVALIILQHTLDTREVNETAKQKANHRLTEHCCQGHLDNRLLNISNV